MKKKVSKKMLVTILIGAILIVLGVLLLLLGKFPFISSKNSEEANNSAFGAIERDVLVHVDKAKLSPDDLYITSERMNYVSESMRLVIPKLSLDTHIAATTLPEELLEMPGLYEFSQLPSVGDVNVSIAGHRDIGKQEFFSLNELEAGDFLYLVYEGVVFQYAFAQSEIVSPDDWSVIKSKGYSALTLTTCDPIGTTLNRLIVVGELVDMSYETAGFEFDSEA